MRGLKRSLCVALVGLLTQACEQPYSFSVSVPQVKSSSSNVHLSQICGTASGSAFLSTPTAQLCATGSTLAGPVSATSTGWIWSCARNGTQSACSAVHQSDDDCATQTILNCMLPVGVPGSTSSGTCASGMSGSCSYSCGAGSAWTKVSNSCAFQAACGSAAGSSFTSAPSSNLCGSTSALINSITSTSAGWSWSCGAGGSTVSCSALLSAPSNCPAQTLYTCAVSNTPSGGTSGQCISGYSGSCSFSCSNGSWNSLSSSCALQASCGASNQQSFVSAPSTNLCGSGSALQGSVQTAQGGWSWTCAAGSNTTACSATQAQPSPCGANTINGCVLPGTSDGGSAGSCTTGDSGSCSYSCSNGVWNQNSNGCTPPPSCGSAANGTVHATAPTSGFCGTGSSLSGSVTQVSNNWSWQCSNGTTSLTCTAPSNYTGNFSYTEPNCSVNASTVIASGSMGTFIASQVPSANASSIAGIIGALSSGTYNYAADTIGSNQYSSSGAFICETFQSLSTFTTAGGIFDLYGRAEGGVRSTIGNWAGAADLVILHDLDVPGGTQGTLVVAINTRIAGPVSGTNYVLINSSIGSASGILANQLQCVGTTSFNSSTGMLTCGTAPQ